MNESIELHDSEVAAISVNGESVMVSFSDAYVHRSLGIPGSDAGSGYLQPATLTFDGASADSLPSEMPVLVSAGFLRIGDAVYENVIPASGRFEGAVELSVVLSTSERLTIRGQQVRIQLQGEPRYIEEFKP